MIKAAGCDDIDPALVCFSDSAFVDNEDRRSAGCNIGMYQGGCIQALSGCPGVAADSTAEAEAIWISLSVKASAHVRQAHCQIFLQDPDAPFAVPLFTDSRAGQIVVSNDRDSSRTRHVDQRFMCSRNMVLRGHNKLLHCDGDLCMLSDIGTKILLSSTSDPKTSIICGAPGAAAPSPVAHHDTNAGTTEEE